MKPIFNTITLLSLLLILGCQKDSVSSLSVSTKDISLPIKGGAESLIITTDASQWTITTDVAWIQLSQTKGSGNSTVNLTVSENTNTGVRVAALVVSANGAPNVLITVTQKGNLYPNYNISPLAPDATGMSSNAVELAKKIKLGFNIGNSLEATGGETNWGNPKITNELIQLAKKSGFNAIRLPCSWNQYADATTAEIKVSWMNRVKEVVQYCVNNDMYVILNIHWDGGWLENNCTPEKQEDNNAKQKAFWQQIATNFRDFDEHLLLASANEPNVENATQMAVLTSYHQTFIDAVRATGGKNANRVLVLQGPSTDIDKSNKLWTQLPTDKTPNRLMAEIHYYTPWNFAGLTKDESWGKQFYYWGKGFHSSTDTERNANWGEEEDVKKYFGLMKTQFIDKGIPVVMGEFSAVRRDNLTGEDLKLHLASRAYFFKYVTNQAKINGLLPFYWDNGGIENLSSGIIDRKKNVVFDKQALDALVQGITE
jgi:endoglucanase